MTQHNGYNVKFKEKGPKHNTQRQAGDWTQGPKPKLNNAKSLNAQNEKSGGKNPPQNSGRGKLES